MSKFKKYLIHVVLILFGLAIGLIGAEIALKILAFNKRGSEFESLDQLRREMLNTSSSEQRKGTSLGDLVLPHADDQIIYVLKPHLDVKFMRAKVRTNSFGMRGPEYPLEKGIDTYRIVLLGDSFAFGWGVEENESFASVLEKNLNHIFMGHPKIEVLNLAVPGYSTFQEVMLFMEKGLCFSPDAVLLYFVENDFGLPFFVQDIRESSKTGGLFSALEFSRLTWNAAHPHAQEQLVQMQGWSPNTMLNKLAQKTESMGIPFFFAMNPKKGQKKYLARLPSLKKHSGVRIIELREGLLRAMEARGIAAKDLTLSFDPHPSPLRHRILGDLMTPHFWAEIDTN
ncbi:MAG: SGNH/GDSL hydrolase family protein [SAR324 cluster bacterium]|uniref:SGNH/GDSL hydrolase family protein n=1 Tax=SAR324 cluster bacterium TaxID=2024889 RepID=A0A7X9IKM0_9DELT|nr:SGNH/GDSL hydrolase family protein [SAR324 cluster bacterium]